MRKRNIILLNLLLISYLVTVGMWALADDVAILIAFSCFSIILFIFVISSMMREKPQEKTEEGEEGEGADEAQLYREVGMQNAAAFAPEQAPEGAQTPQFVPAEGAPVQQPMQQPVSGENTQAPTDEEGYNTSDTVRYMEEIDELKGQLAELQSSLDEANAELSELKRNGGGSGNDSMLSILPQDITPREMLTTINIVDIAQSVANELKADAIRAGLRVQVSAGEDVILVRADENLLRVLFRNIVDNSIKYMNRQGMLVITLSVIGDDLFVVLKDNGEGLSAEETGHIFELNYQGSNRISGNGLGLAQAKAVVEYYGGNIYAKSTPGGGMGIYIQLPTS